MTSSILAALAPSKARIRQARRNECRPRGPRGSMDKLTLLLEREDPFNQRLEIGVRNVVGRHRYRTPDAAATVLDLLLELGRLRGVPRILRRDLLVRRSDQLLVHCVAGLAVVLRQKLRCGGIAGSGRSRGRKRQQSQRRAP